MKRDNSALSVLALTVVVPLWLLSVSIAAADQKGGSDKGGGGGQASAGTASSGSAGSSSAGSGGGGGHVSSGGGGGGHVSSGGGGGHISGGGGGARMGGDRGGTGTARAGGGGGSTMRGPSGSSGSTGSSAGTAVPRGGNNSGMTTGAGNNSGDRATYRGDPGTRKTGDTVPPYSRPRDGKPSVGEAVPRHGPPPVPGGNIYVPGGYFGGYYPWGYGGVGLGGYYGGFYDPCYDPYDYSGYGCGGYGGYGGGGFGYPQSYGSSSPEEGSVHLKIKPREASVYVDGYYVGVVDDFDGVFQKLHMESGAHRIEVRAPGYETLSFDVRVEPGRTTTYKGDLKKIQ